MGGQWRAGFTLIEIIIALTIAGILFAAVPRFIGRRGEPDWNDVHRELNTLLVIARQEAALSRSNHRLLFRRIAHGDQVVVEREVFSKERKKQYEDVSTTYRPARVTLPPSITLKHLFVEGIDQFEKGGTTSAIVVVPSGLVQPAVIQMQRAEKNGGETHRSYAVQSFMGRFVSKQGWSRE